MRIVFMGTPDFAVPSLEALLMRGHEIAAVYTLPDKPKAGQSAGPRARHPGIPAGDAAH